MSDFNSWLNNASPISEESRAAIAWTHIQDKPTSVAFQTPAGVTLAAQTVRVENDDTASSPVSLSGMSGPMRYCIIFGIINHATLADTVMEEGYRFVLNNDEYRISDVIVTLGSIQGNAERSG